MSDVDSKLLRLPPDFVNEVLLGRPHGHTGSVCLCCLKLYLESTHFNSAFRWARQVPKRHELPALGGQNSSVLPPFTVQTGGGRPTGLRRMDVPRCAPYKRVFWSASSQYQIPLITANRQPGRGHYF